MTEQREPGHEPEPENGQNGNRWAPEGAVPAADDPRYGTGEPSRAVQEPTQAGEEPAPVAPAETTSEPTGSAWPPAEPAPVAEPAPEYSQDTAVPESEPAVEQTVVSSPAADSEYPPEPAVQSPSEPEPAVEQTVVSSPATDSGFPPESAVRSPYEPEPAVEQTVVASPSSDDRPDAQRTAVPPPAAPEPLGTPATEATAALPTATGEPAIFRDSPSPQDETVVEPLSDEAQKLAAERAARKEAREAALAAAAPVAVAAPEPVVVHQRTNDKFLGSLGLFLLRLVVAAIFTVRGIHMLSNIVEYQERVFGQTIIPYPQYMPIVTGVAMLAVALALILGLLTRIAGLGVLLIAGGALAFVLWGPWNIFRDPVPGQTGAFLGEFELLLAAVGLLFLLIGGGGWSLDRSFRAARAKDKAESQVAG